MARAHEDINAAQSVTSWFREMGWFEESEGVSDVVKKVPFCLGFQRERIAHWSPNCDILKCCIDEKDLEYCHQCEEFICARLRRWSEKNPRYEEALRRLERVKVQVD